MILHGYDYFALYGFLTTVLSIHVLVSMRLQYPAIRQLHKYWVHQTAVLLEISSAKIGILPNARRYVLKRDAFRKAMAEILGIDANLVEIPLLKPIELNLNSSYSKGPQVAKCCGIKAYISVNTHQMPRRVVMMKLMEANEDGTLVSALDKIWELREEPMIEELVMIYNLFGHLVKPRKRNLEEPTITLTPNSIIPTPKLLPSPQKLGSRDGGGLIISPIAGHFKITPASKNPNRSPYESFSIRY